MVVVVFMEVVAMEAVVMEVVPMEAVIMAKQYSLSLSKN